MKYYLKFILFAPLLIGFVLLPAQQIISLEEAIKLALKNNYGIEIARNEESIAKNNNDLENAGFLPQIDASASNLWSNNNTHQESSTGVITDFNNLKGSNFNGSVGLSWTLFDGTKMFASRNKLNELQKTSNFELQISIENVVYKVINQYYTLVKLKQQIALSQSLLTLFQKRKEVVEARNSSGNSSGLEVLQAQADYNAQNATLLRLQSQYAQAQFIFSSLLVNSPLTTFEVDGNFSMTPLMNIESIRANITQQNVWLKQAKSNMLISDYMTKEARSAYFPKIGFGLNYNFVNSENPSGLIFNNQTYGMNYGFSASWNLFDGMSVKRNVRNAQIQQKIMQLSFNEMNLQIETTLLSQYKLYESNLQIVKMEEQNLTIAQSVLNIAMEKYTVGMISDIQLKDAQNTFEDAQLRLIQARFDAKMSETELLRLQGLLIK